MTASNWWPVIGMLIASVALAALIVLMPTPTPANNKVALGACGRFMILRHADGSLWLRVNGLRSYQIESMEGLVCK